MAFFGPNLFAERIDQLGTENAFKIGPQIQKLESAGHHVIKCNLGEPDFPLPSHVAKAIKKGIDDNLTHYVDPQGMLQLREAVAHDVGLKRDLKISPDRVVVFPGAKPAIGFSQEVYCNPGDEVIYPSPGFPIYESFTKYLGLVPVPHHLGQELEPLLSEKTKLIFLNFPSNPTGAVAEKTQLESMADIILRKAPKNVRIFSDEIYENILFDGGQHLSIASIPGMEEKTIISSGASKTYSWTGGRIGWAIFPTAEEAETFKQLNINYFSCTAGYNQMGAIAALTSPESKGFIERMVGAFQERRDLLVSGLNGIEGVRCPSPKGAFYLFPNIQGLCEKIGAMDAFAAMPKVKQLRSSPSTLFQGFLLSRYYVATLDRRSFGSIGAQESHFLRISIATSLADLKEAVKRIEKAAADRQGFATFLRDETPAS